MSLSHMQLTAVSDEEMPPWAAPTPRPSRRRGLGLAVTIVGLVCIVGAHWPNTKRVTARQHFVTFKDAIVQAFDESVLADQPSMVTTMEFEFGEEGAEAPSAMEISAKIEIDDDPQESFDFEHTFLAEEGKGEDLKHFFDQVLADVDDSDDEEPVFADLIQLVTVTQTGDEVLFAISLPMAPPELAQKFEGQNAEFDASFKFGRDLDTLYANMDDNAIVAWHGLHFKIDARFKGLVAAALTQMLPLPPAEEGGSDMAREALHWGLGFSSLGGKLELRYKQPEELGDLFDKAPTMAEFFDVLKGKIMMDQSPIMKSVRERLLELRGVLNGWKKTEIRGLGESYKITMDYTNFKPSKLIVKMIDELQSGEDSEDDSAEEDPAEETDNEPVEDPTEDTAEETETEPVEDSTEVEETETEPVEDSAEDPVEEVSAENAGA